MRKYILLLLFLSTSAVTNAQIPSAKDSLCSSLIRLNHEETLSSEEFDELCNCLTNKTITFNRTGIVRFEETIHPLTDSTSSNPYRTYKKSRKDPDSYCNGYYWIAPYRNQNMPSYFLFGVNSNLIKGLFVVPNKPFSRKWVCGGFKKGIPEGIWEYEIAETDDKIFKYENYTHGLLNGNYTITTTSNDTLYHTQFKNGSGYYKDYYPNGEPQLEGNVKNGIAHGRWIFYYYSNDKKLDAIYLETFLDGETILFERFFSNRPKNSL